jgi:hypothetical protein
MRREPRRPRCGGEEGTTIVFIDQRKRHLRTLRKQESDYAEDLCVSGAFRLEAMGNIELPLEWLFVEPRPGMREASGSLLGG